MSLAISYEELRREIGRFIGIGRDSDAWTTDQATDVSDILRAGLRKFYYPGEHRWSFLCPTATLDVAADDFDYDLPLDFCGMWSNFSFAQGAVQRNVTPMEEHDLRSILSMRNSSGPPRYYAVRVKPQAPGNVERYEVIFHPVPNVAYTLTYRYVLDCPDLSLSNIYHLGGARHSETLLESCLAIAESRLDDQEQIHYKRFMECLAMSIQLDASERLGPRINVVQGLMPKTIPEP